MVDLHAHILPKVDDGSTSVEESIEMLTQMRQAGITAVVATPHFDMRRDTLERFLTRRERAYRKLMDAAKGVDIPMVLLGAEVLYCGVGLNRIEEIDKLCLGNSRYLLVETLKGVWDETFHLDMRKLMAEQNITPILAHVERYIYIRKNRKKMYVMQDEGMAAQSNAEFFTKRLSRCNALRLLKKKRIQFLGSDCHNMTERKPNLSEAMQVIRESLGEEYVEKLQRRSQKVITAEKQ